MTNLTRIVFISRVSLFPPPPPRRKTLARPLFSKQQPPSMRNLLHRGVSHFNSRPRYPRILPNCFQARYTRRRISRTEERACMHVPRRREYLSGSGEEQRVARNRACFRSINNLSANTRGLVRAAGNPPENLNPGTMRSRPGLWK